MASRADSDADFEQEGPGVAGSKTQPIPATKRQDSKDVGSKPQLATTRSKTASANVVGSETSPRQSPQASLFEKELHESKYEPLIDDCAQACTMEERAGTLVARLFATGTSAPGGG